MTKKEFMQRLRDSLGHIDIEKAEILYKYHDDLCKEEDDDESVEIIGRDFRVVFQKEIENRCKDIANVNLELFPEDRIKIKDFESFEGFAISYSIELGGANIIQEGSINGDYFYIIEAGTELI